MTAKTFRFGSVCSGIEAATLAFKPLGWEAAFYSEIEKFPRAVLAHHYPETPCHGDFTTIKGDEYGAIDLLCGGTPCQSFSVAGLRKGMDDPRGNLALGFLGLAERTRAEWLVWENVPGVLSSNGGRDFGAFLGALGELGYGWAYRILDAQYFGVAQRRRRVFVVGYLGDWRPAAAVLFERESLCGNPAPRRETGEEVAGTFTARAKSGGWGQDPNLAAGGYMRPAEQKIPEKTGALAAETYTAGMGGRVDAAAQGFVIPEQQWPPEIAPTLDAHFGEKMGLENQHINAGGGYSPLARCLTGSMQRLDAETETLIPCRGGFFDDDIAHTLRAEGFDASEDGTGRQNLVPIAFSSKDDGRDATNDLSPTLRAMGHANSHPNSGGQIAIAIQERASCENPDAGPGGSGVRSDGVAFTLEARPVPQAVAFQQNQLGEIRTNDVAGTLNTNSNASGRNTPMAMTRHAVRRLTPRECERLQGFPDDYTLIPNARRGHAADGPRYKAIGNSWAVPCAAWIGARIAVVEKILKSQNERTEK